MSTADRLKFLAAWIRRPLRIASVTPSSPQLAALMTRDLAPDRVPVLELGPGTGVFTEAVQARGVAQRDLTLVEREAAFIPMLRARFPEATVLEGDAADICGHVLSRDIRYHAVVSGLPLPSLRRADLSRLLTACFDRLTPDGGFYQFTYGPVCPVPVAMLRALGLDAERIGSTLRNFPPAAVYRISRRSRPADGRSAGAAGLAAA